MNLELVEKWEVHLNHHDGNTSLYRSYDDESEASHITDIINYDSSSDFQGNKTDSSLCFENIKSASLFRVRHYAIKYKKIS
jgi:hypothetical protein